MYSNSELNAVELSPTKKDFYSIWNELLEVSSKLSARWDPTATNEADPGIVLLKVLTAIADKLNYAIDANTLEAFMPSAAQEASMRKLCDMLGYSMRYYQSATTTAKITYVGKEFPDIGSIIIDQFTNLKDLDGTVNYVTLKQVRLQEEEKSVTVPCMEGELIYCEADNGEAITLRNLDDTYRYYLPESQVAENGIFVYNVINGYSIFSEIEWEQTDNLNVHPLGSKVYKFGLDASLGLPYLQFPADISNLISDGLRIAYIRTRGASGNIAALTLNRLEKPETWSESENSGEWADPAKYNVTNITPAKNGANPETIDEAYWSYQKTIGTFDTLVTCRDYMNKIYNLTLSDTSTTPLVSNIIVSDIRDDINSACTICTLGAEGISYEVHSKKDSEDADLINHFDLVLYPFKTILGLNTKEEFSDSFSYSDRNYFEICSALEDSKTIAHKLRLPYEDDIVCIKVYLLLNAKINTTYRVSALEAQAIEKSIYTALYSKFNSRYVSFGEELPYDLILKAIEGADIRIKSVVLDEPKTRIVAKLRGGAEHVIVSESGEKVKEDAANIYLKLIANNVIAGRVPLFNYYENFSTSYSERTPKGYLSKYTGAEAKASTTTTVTKRPTDVFEDAPWPQDEIENIATVTSEGTLMLTPEVACIEGDFPVDTTKINSVNPLKLTSNEVIQFRLPNLVNDLTYPAYTNYYAHLPKVKSLSKAAVPATMQSLKSFFNGGITVESFYDANSDYWKNYVATYQLADSETNYNLNSWTPIDSWEEKINDMYFGQDGKFNGLITCVVDEDTPYDTIDAITAAIKAAEEKYVMLFVESFGKYSDRQYFSALRQKYIQIEEKTYPISLIDNELYYKETEEAPSTADGSTKVESSATIGHYKVETDADGKFHISESLYALTLNQSNFTSFISWITTTSCHRLDTTDPIADSTDVPTKIVIDGKLADNITNEGYGVEYTSNGERFQVVSGIYRLSGTSFSYNPGLLVDSVHNRYSLVSSYEFNFENYWSTKYYVPRLWSSYDSDTTTSIPHSQSGVGRDLEAAYIPKDGDYELKEDEYILFNYASSAGQEAGNTVTVNKYLGAGTIIRPNFNLEDSSDAAVSLGYVKTSGYGPWQKPDGGIIDKQAIRGMLSLGVNEQIEHRKKAFVELCEPKTYVYWVLNNEKLLAGGNTITFPVDNDKYTLQPGEYFYYTDANKQDLAYYGSGTEIALKGIKLTKSLEDSQASADQINEYGLDAAIPWTLLNLDKDNHKITITEFQYHTLAAGDKLYNIKLDNGSTSLDHTFKPIAPNAEVSYESNGLRAKLPSVQISNMQWEACSRLDLELSAEVPQVLHLHKSGNEIVARDIITLKYNTSEGLQEIQSYSPQPDEYNDIALYASSPIINSSGQAYLQNIQEQEKAGIIYSSPYSFKCVDKQQLTLLTNDSIFDEMTEDNNYSVLTLPKTVEKVDCLRLNTLLPDNTFGIMALYNPITDASVSVTLKPSSSTITYVYKDITTGDDCRVSKEVIWDNDKIALDPFQAVWPKLWPKPNLPEDKYFYGWSLNEVSDEILQGWQPQENFSVSDALTLYAVFGSTEPVSIPTQFINNATDHTAIFTSFSNGDVCESELTLKSGLNIIKLSEINAVIISANNTNGEVLKFSPLYLVNADNPLNPKLGCHDWSEIEGAEEGTYSAYSKLLEILQNYNVSDNFLYCLPPRLRTGLDLNNEDPEDTLRLAKYWFDKDNINNKFVVAEIHPSYLESNKHVTVSKSSRYQV